MPQYIFNPETAEWKHKSNLVFKERQWLQRVSYAGGKFNVIRSNQSKEIPTFTQMLMESDQIFRSAYKVIFYHI